MRQLVSFYNYSEQEYNYTTGNTDVSLNFIESAYCEVVNQGEQTMNLLYGGFKEQAFTIYSLIDIKCDVIKIGEASYQVDRHRHIGRDTIYEVSRM